jgi:general secretion pathway protein D
MITFHFHGHKLLAGLLALGFCAVFPTQAQQNRGGGNFGGGGNRTSTSGSGTSRTYPNSGQIGDAYFTIDPESRRVVTIADEDTSKYISMVLSNLDRPKPQVLIKVVFLEVTHNNALDIGIEGGWDKQIGTGTSANAANAFGMSGLATSSATNFNALGQPISSFANSSSSGISAPGAGLYQVLGADYQVTLRAIAQAGKTKIISKPSILARNNQPATITVGQSVPLITSVRYDNYGNAINSISYQDVGVILTVTPFITADNLVEMIVTPQISSIDPTLSEPISANVSAPVIDVRKADTVVVTPDGQTVIIGGLMENDKTVIDTKIPFLGDIPVLGALFKRHQASTANTELIIFLTPHIVQAPSQLLALSTKETLKADAPKGLTDQEVDKFLEGIRVKAPLTNAPPAKGSAPKINVAPPKNNF